MTGELKSETLAYKMLPAGHEEQKPKREYQKPNSKLREVFEKWIDKCGIDHYYNEENDINIMYDIATKSLAGLKFSTDEVYALLVSHQDHENFQNAGLFLSAVYNQIPDKEIVFDLPLKMHSVGRFLSKGKTLIVKTPTEEDLGKRAAGNIINMSETGSSMGSETTGIVLNYGLAAYHLGNSANKIVINYGKCRLNYGDSAKGLIINMGEADDQFGDGASAILLNYGKAGDNLGEDLKHEGLLVNCGEAGKRFAYEARGIVIALKKPASYGDAEIAVMHDDPLVSTLTSKLDAIKTKLEPGRNDYHLALKAAKELKPFIIRKTIENMVGY